MKSLLTGLVFIFLFSPAGIYSQEVTNETKTVIADEFGMFSDGLCAVKKGEKWGFIDTTGALVIDFTLDHYSLFFNKPYFSNGLCMLEQTEQGKRAIRYIDKSGKKAFEFVGVAGGTPFCGGYAKITEAGRNAKVMYIDTKGKEVKSLSISTTGFGRTNDLYPFVNGYAAYFDVNTSKLGFMNDKGKVIIKPEYDEVTFFSEGLAAVKKKTSTGEDKWGYIDETGKAAIDFMFTYQPGEFSEGLAAVFNKDYKVGYINKEGKIVIEPQYAAVPVNKDFCYKVMNASFRNGTVFAQIPYKDLLLLDTSGNTLKKIELNEFSIISECKEDSFYVFGVGSGYRFGIIDYNGNVLLDQKNFEMITKFSEGLAFARGFVNDKRVTGFIDKYGTFKIVKGESQF